ncbi:MAG TPA: helix-hairpin-helix domain-containing protein [Albitalea sp.]
MNTTRQRTALGGLLALALIALGPWALGPVAAAGNDAPGVQPPRTTASAPPPAAKKKPPATPQRLIDINSASRKELKMLPGIGDAEADRIVAGRPYKTKTDLATEKVIPTGVYLSIRRSIVATPPKQPSGKS